MVGVGWYDRRAVGTHDEELDLFNDRFSTRTGLADDDFVTGIDEGLIVVVPPPPFCVLVVFLASISRERALKKLRRGFGELSTTTVRGFLPTADESVTRDKFLLAAIRVTDAIFVNRFSLLIIGFDLERHLACEETVDFCACNKRHS